MTADGRPPTARICTLIVFSAVSGHRSAVRDVQIYDGVSSYETSLLKREGVNQKSPPERRAFLIIVVVSVFASYNASYRKHYFISVIALSRSPVATAAPNLLGEDNLMTAGNIRDT